MHNNQEANNEQDTDDYLDTGFSISGTPFLSLPTPGTLSLGFPTPGTHPLGPFALGATPLSLFIPRTILFSLFIANVTSSGPLNRGFSSLLFHFLPYFCLSLFSFPCYFGFGDVFQQDLDAHFHHITPNSISLIRVFRATLLLLKKIM